MAQPPQSTSVRLPQPLHLFEGRSQFLDVRIDQALLGLGELSQRASAPRHRKTPHRNQHAFRQHHDDAGHQQPHAEPAKCVYGDYSFGSPSSSSATGAMATIWSSGAMRMTITPCVWRPIWEMAPTCVRKTIPLALITSTSSSGSLTTRIATSLPTRSVILSVKTPCPARWCIGYSETGVRLP